MFLLFKMTFLINQGRKEKGKGEQRWKNHSNNKQVHLASIKTSSKISAAVNDTNTIFYIASRL